MNQNSLQNVIILPELSLLYVIRQEVVLVESLVSVIMELTVFYQCITRSSIDYVWNLVASVGHAFAKARYLDTTMHSFLSVDPAIYNLTESGNTKKNSSQDSLQSIKGNIRTNTIDSQNVLLDPQSLNSYSYARNNPIIYLDPDGKVIVPVIFGIIAIYGYIQTSIDIYDAYNMNVKYANVSTLEEKDSTKSKIGMDALFMITGQGATRVGLEKLGQTLEVLTTTLDTTDTFFGKQIYKNVNNKSLISNTKQDNLKTVLPKNTNNSNNTTKGTPTIKQQQTNNFISPELFNVLLNLIKNKKI